MAKQETQRLDLLLVERSLVESREQARRLIMAGEVFLEDQVSDKPGKQVSCDADLRLRQMPRFVSRGGLKLAAAIEEFDLDVAGQVALDIGASTGGFTDCLLQHGVRKVYAIDVGYGQIAWKLRTDERVVVIERTNIRYLEALPDSDQAGKTESATLATIDVSFISLRLVIPAVLNLLDQHASIIALIKPQFEAGKGKVGRGGVVRDEKIHRQVLEEVLNFSRALALTPTHLTVSPILGPAGNVEFLVRLVRGLSQNHSASPLDQLDKDAIDQVLVQAKLKRKKTSDH